MLRKVATICLFKRKSSCASVPNANGQSSLEFLYATSMMLLVFAVVALLYYQSQSDSAILSSYAEARRICHLVASQISSVAASGDGTSALLGLPDSLGGRNYSVFLSGQNRTVTVVYAEQGTTCPLSVANVTNGTSSSFYLLNGTSMRNSFGGVVLG